MLLEEALQEKAAAVQEKAAGDALLRTEQGKGGEGPGVRECGGVRGCIIKCFGVRGRERGRVRCTYVRVRSGLCLLPTNFLNDGIDRAYQQADETT